MVRFDASQLAAICRRHDVHRLRLFGSVARGEARPGSDIDLLVDFAVPKGFFDLIRLEDELRALFGQPVDLVTEPGLSPYFREPILGSASVIFDAAA
jgi:predicted nucleotidyltransferase